VQQAISQTAFQEALQEEEELNKLLLQLLNLKFQLLAKVIKQDC
jgi:hypothetical protein